MRRISCSGMRTVGRLSQYRESPYGITVLSGSFPPVSWSTTRVGGLATVAMAGPPDGLACWLRHLVLARRHDQLEQLDDAMLVRRVVGAVERGDAVLLDEADQRSVRPLFDGERPDQLDAAVDKLLGGEWPLRLDLLFHL